MGDSAVRKVFATAVFLMALPFAVFAADNPELRTLKEADQSDRNDRKVRENGNELRRRDAERRERVLEILRASELSTAWDYFNAALILQHGGSVEHIRLAHSLSTVAATIDPEHPRAKWLMAASWDRLMLRLKQPQWYGTQSVKDTSGRFVLYIVHPDAVSDADRQALGVPTLIEAQASLDLRNGSE
jgi:hypothetical protein